MTAKIMPITRRGLMELLAGGAGLAALGAPASALAQGRKDVLVIGLDISDAKSFDPATATGPSPPVACKISYDTLVTMTDGDYTTVKPALATAWERTPDGKGWRFTLRDGVKFSSGNPMTAEDVKWSFDRLINMQGQPIAYIPNVAETKIADDRHFDVILKDPAQAILEILCASHFIVYDRKVLETHGGDVSLDAKTADKATTWLNTHSCGTGAYTMTDWQRNISLQFERNPHYWGGTPPFQRLIIRHMAEPATQLLAIQRGDIDVAFNLIPEQLETLKTAAHVRVQKVESLDLIYFGLTANPEYNKALAVREARQAIAWAIDYEGIRDGVLGGSALLPASVLPLGTLGSTPEIAKQIGFHENLDKAKVLLAKAGFPDGFSFKLSYGNSLVDGVPYSVLVQKVQSDLARVGIKAELDPQDLVTLRTMYYAGHATSMITSWSVEGVDNAIWAGAAVQRLAVRMHYKVPKDLSDLYDKAVDETDREKKTQLWIAFQKRMMEEAYLLVLFQPVYQIAVSDRIKSFPLNAAGWFADFDAVS